MSLCTIQRHMFSNGLRNRIMYNHSNSLFTTEIYKRVLSFLNPRLFSTTVSYVQGQSVKKNIREYFYYIDHQGMLFLDDARIKNFTSCFKDKEFLVFFFKRLRPNITSRYEDSFPFVSLCGRERNYVRCDDVPIVYTHVIEKECKDMFCYGNAGDLMHNEFMPDRIYMSPDSGRVYHPCHEMGGSVGLVASKLAVEFSKLFVFGNGDANPPTHFKWKNKIHILDTHWFFKQYKVVQKGSL